MTRSRASAGLRRSLQALRRYGLLLVSDRALPSVAGLVAGELVRGSWWGHPRGHEIYDVLGALSSHPDVTLVKLVSGKSTYVHRSLWPALLGAAAARAPWQVRGLSTGARSLLDMVTKDGEAQTDRIPWVRGGRGQSPAEAARELERRLLVYSVQVHTSAGFHAKRLESWSRWRKRVKFAGRAMAPARGKQKLEVALQTLNEQFGGNGRLPWSEA